LARPPGFILLSHHIFNDFNEISFSSVLRRRKLTTFF
jgi:hypothetical protein